MIGWRLKKPFNKKIFNAILGVSVGALTVAGIAAAFAYKDTNPLKKVFFNFSQYASDSNLEKMQEHFNYRTYSDVEEFKDQLLASKIASGITSLYTAASFIKDGLIQPIDYDAFFNLETPRGANFYDDDWAKKTFTPVVYQQLKSYDEYLNSNENLKNKYPNQPLHFWNFFVPYYAQEKIFAYDWNDLDKTKLTDKEKENLEIDFDTRLAEKNQDNSLGNVMQITNSLFSNNQMIVVHDEMRDNYAIGSSNFVDQEVENFDPVLSLKDNKYQKYLDQFSSDISNATNNSTFADVAKLQMLPDSDIVLNSLINPDLNVGASVMYNGDAIDAFFAKDNFQKYKDEENNIDITPVRIKKLKTEIVLIDGLILPSYLTENEKKDVLKTTHDSLYDGWFVEDYQTIPDELYGTYQNKNSSETSQMYDDENSTFTKEGFKNYDFVNFNPVTNLANNLILYGAPEIPEATEEGIDYSSNYMASYLEDYYSNGENASEEEKATFAKYLNIVSNIGNISYATKVPTFINPISDVLSAAVKIYYENKFKN
ncbi:hypothetical protein [Mycoplasmopsis agassizii]|uniref:hypothetical protein n=1 Tax=Mycoplasmopsis agassizii TaxID=33922 RepID=UPI0009D7FE89|nr:hypothetical protein [Mycoplasmopsis agassizii]SMC15950.1 hypothetical protein SAMN02745179_00167 [Mycoplasmopsis agassizii]